MKKLFTLLTALLCVLGVNAQRQVDLQVTLFNPAANATIDSGVSFNLKFGVKNVGTTPLKAGDSVLFVPTLGGQGLGLYYVAGKLGKVMNPNDTLLIDFTYSVNYTTPWTNDTPMQFCVVVAPRNLTADSVRDNSTANNSSCHTIKLKGNYSPTASISQFNGSMITPAQVNLYPNPAQSEINFNVKTESIAAVAIRITDITGRTILVEDKGKMSGDKTFKVNTNDFKNGLYLYQIQIGQEIRTGKFLIAK